MAKNQLANRQIKIIVIVGPTASGKSDLALRLAKLAPSFAKVSAGKQSKAYEKKGVSGAEIISADSRQVYRGMDIGTGKVARDKTDKPKKTRSYLSHDRIKNTISKKSNCGYYSDGIRHYLIDVASPKTQFTADDFKKLGQKAIKEILAKNKVPIIVGGTGFYIDVLLDRMSVAEVPPNKKLRNKLGNLEIEKLFEKLKKLDPERAKTIDSKNKRRLIRAIEVAMARKSTKKAPKNKSDLYYDRGINQTVTKYDTLWLGLNPGKEKLAKKIKKRLDERLSPSFATSFVKTSKVKKATKGKEGMVKEVVRLRKQGVSWKRLDDFGLEYRWISRWLRKNRKQRTQELFSNSQEFENLLRDIIKYSKRQMTWFKRNKEIHWLAPSNLSRVVSREVEGIKNQDEAFHLVKSFLNGV
ncbi:MAG: hypothetical protein HYX22_03675 [Candidatus Yanofskybacteria bacterium]|nr:hypothetical protein [Candidatus Yanofskybacteria bacterium]